MGIKDAAAAAAAAAADDDDEDDYGDNKSIRYSSHPLPALD